MATLHSHTKDVASLTPAERAAMLGLLSIEFLGVRREDFLKDLSEKEVVVLIRLENSEGEIVGFSTLMTLDLPVAGRKVKGIFSGDTIVLEEYRQTTGIGIGLAGYFLKTLEAFPGWEVYYILISKGWRTYRVMPLFFNHFVPRHDSKTTLEDKVVMDAFGQMKYPADFRPESGLIMFTKETQRLIPGSADAIPPVEPDVHTRFFLERNPTYLAGTELVCLARVDENNFAPAMTRFVRTCRKEKR